MKFFLISESSHLGITKSCARLRRLCVWVLTGGSSWCSTWSQLCIMELNNWASAASHIFLNVWKLGGRNKRISAREKSSPWKAVCVPKISFDRNSSPGGAVECLCCSRPRSSNVIGIAGPKCSIRLCWPPDPVTDWTINLVSSDLLFSGFDHILRTRHLASTSAYNRCGVWLLGCFWN